MTGNGFAIAHRIDLGADLLRLAVSLESLRYSLR
jgi:hypothetical protein